MRFLTRLFDHCSAPEVPALILIVTLLVILQRGVEFAARHPVDQFLQIAMRF